MSWNYRIIDHGDHFALHEVHYHADGSVKSYTAEPITFVADPADGPSDIETALHAAASDAAKPVLKAADLPGGGGA